MSKTVCFCFKYTEDDIVEDARASGGTTIVKKIQDAKRNGHCECKEKNPSGC